MSSSDERAPVAATCASSRFLRTRYSLTSRARFSLSTACNTSPASGTPSRPRISTGTDGPALSIGWPRSSSSARARPQAAPQTTMSPTSSVPRWMSAVATDAAAAIELGLDDRTLRLAVGIGLEVEQLGLELDGLDQLVEAGPLQGADRHRLDVAAEILDHHLVAEQVVLDPIRIGFGPVHLVDRHHDRRPLPPWRGGWPRSSAA